MISAERELSLKRKPDAPRWHPAGQAFAGSDPAPLISQRWTDISGGTSRGIYRIQNRLTHLEL